MKSRLNRNLSLVFATLAVGALLVAAFSFSKVKNATAYGCGYGCPTPTPTPTVDPCNATFTYEKTSDFSDNRVNINFHDSDHQIDVSAKSGYSVTEVWLDVQGDGYSGYHLYATGPVNNFNPPGDDINKAKVIVKKDCRAVCNDETATNFEELIPGQTYADNKLCVYPSSSPSPSPSETPTPTPTPSSSGGTGGTGGGPVAAPVCTNTAPAAPTLLSATIVGANSIKIVWNKVAGADHYSIFYGPTSGNYLYGVPDTGDTDNFVINGLGAGCFVVKAANGCAPGPSSNEVCTGGIGGAQVLGASTMAGTGTFGDNLFSLFFTVGALLMGVGIRKYALSSSKK